MTSTEIKVGIKNKNHLSHHSSIGIEPVGNNGHRMVLREGVVVYPQQPAWFPYFREVGVRHQHLQEDQHPQRVQRYQHLLVILKELNELEMILHMHSI